MESRKAMNRLRHLRRAVSSLALVAPIACHDAEIPSAAVDPVTPPVSSVPIGPRTISVGDAVIGTITRADSECLFATENGGWGGLCHAFEIPVDASGVLETTLTWSDEVPMSVFVKTSAGSQIDMICCNGSSLSLAVPVEEGGRYRLEVAYAGRSL